MDWPYVSARNSADREPIGTPPEAPMEMPVQNLRKWAKAAPAPKAALRQALTRFAVIGGTVALTLFGADQMMRVVEIGTVTFLERIYVGLFVITFGWIAFSSVAMLVGLLTWRPTPVANLAPDAPKTRTALVMPVYNENPVDTAAALRVMADLLFDRGEADGYEIVVLSDTTDADVWINETKVFARLQADLKNVMPVWYRRRWRNEARKAGNVADFIRRWGGRYDFFIVLDADSLLDAHTLIRLTREMRADSSLGLLQTVPMLAGGETLFARLQQFASDVYGPVLARGLAAWAGDDGNYWGHNAIIRTSAFAETAGLPELKGRKPIGGAIMSHDFVEAALMRRAGWRVRMIPELEGSYEDCPPSLIDVAVRDRRWAQGNLQHLGVITARGLRWPSRLHLATGIMSYLSATLWLTLIGVGLALAAQAYLSQPEYFIEEYQLYPYWPRFDSERMFNVFLLTIGVLLLPKFVGYVRIAISKQRRRAAGGFIRLTFSVLLEVILSALYAPIMMIIQNHHLLQIVRGRDSGWITQRRGAKKDGWRRVWAVHRWHAAAGLIMGGVLGSMSLPLLAWMSPVVAGLVLAVPLSWMSGSAAIGAALRWMGLLLVDSETRKPSVIRRRDEVAGSMPLLSPDGLEMLARDPEAAETHLAFNEPRPLCPPGKPDSDLLTAEAKLQQAANLEEALSWLTPAERVRVAAEPKLLARLTALAEETNLRSLRFPALD